MICDLDFFFHIVVLNSLSNRYLSIFSKYLSVIHLRRIMAAASDLPDVEERDARVYSSLSNKEKAALRRFMERTVDRPFVQAAPASSSSWSFSSSKKEKDTTTQAAQSGPSVRDIIEKHLYAGDSVFRYSVRFLRARKVNMNE